jgi:(1->4)-alpha-D-glucan 1-alpha-D-glucosylmutase
MHIPTSIYRLQLTPSFSIWDTKALIPYLHNLGITDIYASPIFKSRKGSQHGYDITDPNTLNPELGGEPGFEKLIPEVQRFDMGWLQDIVPNHIAYDYENSELVDVLEKGDHSHYFDFFDIVLDLNLVDPDNRLPVDFNKRRIYLNEIKERTLTELIE